MFHAGCFDGRARARQGEAVPDRLFPAIAYRLCSVIAFVTMGTLIKIAETRGARLGELLFFRQCLALPVVVFAVMTGPGLATLRTKRIGAHALRTAVGLSSMAFMFTTVILLPLAEATTMQFTVPIFATILGALILKEPTGWHRWGAVAYTAARCHNRADGSVAERLRLDPAAADQSDRIADNDCFLLFGPVAACSCTHLYCSNDAT
jgi:hypothetical protein